MGKAISVLQRSPAFRKPLPFSRRRISPAWAINSPLALNPQTKFPQRCAAFRIDLFFQLTSSVEAVALRIDGERGWTYLGLDLSPAPSKDSSIVTAIENISHEPLGSNGTLSAVGIITAAMKEIGLRKTGFSGVMLPVLEDSVLAERWNSGAVNLDSLLSYSSVCGTSLDTIPLPGTATVEQLSRIIGDVATLSVKWNKPLTARLLPVPGKAAGQPSDFSESRFLNATIQPISTPEAH
jgi:uncharacterized protein